MFVFFVVCCCCCCCCRHSGSVGGQRGNTPAVTRTWGSCTLSTSGHFEREDLDREVELNEESGVGDGLDVEVVPG